MRQVFTSPRLENVESVAKLLRDNEIEVKITNGRTFRGAIRGNFSYREPPDRSEQPAVWVLRSDDQPKARILLREAGLLDSGRSATTYLATPTVHQLRGDDGSDAARRRAFRIKVALFLGIAAALGMTLFALRTTTPTPVAAKPAALTTATVVAATADIPMETYIVATPKALAAMLVGAELAAQPASRLCVSIDGETPTREQIDALRLPKEVRASPASECAKAKATGALTIAIDQYRTDGSGVGTIQIEITDRDKDGKPRVDARTLEVQRDDERWRVLRVLQ
jgi:hypothetical protein